MLEKGTINLQNATIKLYFVKFVKFVTVAASVTNLGISATFYIYFWKQQSALSYRGLNVKLVLL